MGSKANKQNAAMLKELGKINTALKKRVATIRMEPELYQRISDAAWEERKSMNQWCLDVLAANANPARFGVAEASTDVAPAIPEEVAGCGSGS